MSHQHGFSLSLSLSVSSLDLPFSLGLFLIGFAESEKLLRPSLSALALLSKKD